MPNFTPQPIDLSGILNSFNSIPAAQANNALLDQMNNAWSGIPQSSGVNLSNIPLGQFHATAAGFMPTSSTSGLSASAVPGLVAQSQQPGFWGTIGNAIGNAWHTTTTDIGGLLRGIANPALSRQADLERQFGPLTPNNPNVVLGPHGLMYKNQPTSWTNPFAGVAQAAHNPAQSMQQFNQNLNQSVTGMNPFEATMIRAGLTTPLSAVTYLPISTAARVTGVTPAMKFGYDWLKGAVKGLPNTVSVLDDMAKGTSEASKAAPLGLTAPQLGLPTGNIAADEAMRTAQNFNPFASSLLGLPSGSRLALPAMTESGAQEAARIAEQNAMDAARAEREALGKQINSWAGLNGGFSPILQAFSKPATVANIARPGAFKLAPNANELLQTLFNTAKANSPLPAGREFETLQDLLGSISGRTGVDLNTLIDQSTKVPQLSSIISNALARNENLSKFGLSVKDAFPNAFKQGSKTVMQEVSQDPNFTMQFPLVLRNANEGLVPVGNAFTNRVFDTAPKLSQEEAARIAGQSPVGNPFSRFVNPDLARARSLRDISQQLRDARIAANASKDTIPNAAAQTASSSKFPYAAFNWQSKIGAPLANALKSIAPNGVPGIRNAIGNGEKLSEELFKPLGGARSYFVNAVGKMFGANQSDRNALKLALQNVSKGVSPEQAAALTHALEQTSFGSALNDPALEAIRQQIDPIREGINNRSATMLNNQLDTNAMGVGQHISHVRTDKFAEDGQPIVDGAKLLKTTFDSANARSIPGTIKDINANPDLPNFEENLFKILAHHGDQVNRAANARSLINEAIDHGLPTDGKISENEIFPGTHQKAKTFTFGDKSVLLPESEVKFLKGVIDPESETTLSKLYRGGVNAANRLMFLGSPLIHIGNNLGWQTLSHAPDIFGRMMNRDLWKQAFTNVRPESTMDQALQNGALHLSSEIGQRGSTKQFVSDVMNGINNPKGSNPLAAIAKGYLNLTPNVEKIYRTAAFQHALDQGMAPEDATKWVKSVFGGNAPGTESRAEHALTSFMPFFNWTKTAIGSNVKNALKNPAPYSAAFNLMDAINQQNTNGNHFWQNKNPLSIALGTQNEKGLNEFWEPYFPALDPLKLGNDIAQNGIWSGPANFAFGRFNPIAKFLTQMATKELNPAGLPPNKRSTMPSPDLPTNSTFNTESLFGDRGPMVPFAVSQLVQDFPNPFESAQRMNGESTPAKLLTNPFASLSGTISAPNVVSDAKHAKYFQGQQGGEIRNWLKKFAQQVQTQ